MGGAQPVLGEPRTSRLPASVREALSAAGDKGQTLATKAGKSLSKATPDQVKQAGGMALDAVLVPTATAVTSLLEFTVEVVTEFSKPDSVIAHHQANGHQVETIADLRNLDLKELDAFTQRMALKWRGMGIVEGGAIGALAFIPGPGTVASITLDVIVSHALTSAIATRVAYAYGFDATDPDQQEHIQRMVRRSYVELAPRTGTVQQASRAFAAGRDRVRWSEALRRNERMLAAVEKLMKATSGGAHVPVQKAVRAMPVVGVVASAGLNQHMLSQTAKQARLYSATVLLSEKYDLPLPSRLSNIPVIMDEEGEGL